MKPSPQKSLEENLDTSALQEALKRKREKLAQTKLGDQPESDGLQIQGG